MDQRPADEPTTNGQEPELPALAAAWAEVGLTNIEQEYPNDLRHAMRGPADQGVPREIHPAFYGSYDWHSCMELPSDRGGAGPMAGVGLCSSAMR